jgi:hypothetical protein
MPKTSKRTTKAIKNEDDSMPIPLKGGNGNAMMNVIRTTAEERADTQRRIQGLIDEGMMEPIIWTTFWGHYDAKLLRKEARENLSK